MFFKKKLEEIPEDRVHLKSLFGIRPGVYLAFLYGIAIIAVLFFVLLYPGLSNPGSIFVSASEPEGAAVFVDGVYRASTPVEVFVPEGAHRIEISIPGFNTQQQDIDVKGRVFASLFSPKKVRLSVTLETSDPLSVFMQGASEYAAWSFAGEPTATYQIPQSLSEAAYRIGPASNVNPELKASLQSTIQASARFASNRASLRDLIRADYLIANAGLSPSPLTLLSSAQELLSYLSQNPDAASALASVLPAESSAILTDSAWYKKQAARSDALSTDAPSLGFIVAEIQPEIPSALSFQEVRAQQNFSISTTAVSRLSWDAFVESNPEWKKENIQALIEKRLVNDEYLAETDAAVTGVSWYAAKAFCAWLSSLLHYEVRLPTETEWEYCNALGLNVQSKTEWCEDYYAPFNSLSADKESTEAIGSPERSVRGKDLKRGSLPPEFCSPFMSFRVVKKGD